MLGGFLPVLFLDLDLLRICSTDCDNDRPSDRDTDVDLLRDFLSLVDLIGTEFTLLDLLLLREERTGDLNTRGFTGFCDLFARGMSFMP